MLIYIHHACRERYILTKPEGYVNRASGDVNFVSILSSAPYGVVDVDTRISTALWKELNSEADTSTAELMIPNYKLLNWDVGSSRQNDEIIFRNKSIGEITCKPKFYIIVAFKPIAEAIADGATFHA